VCGKTASTLRHHIHNNKIKLKPSRQASVQVPHGTGTNNRGTKQSHRNPKRTASTRSCHWSWSGRCAVHPSPYPRPPSSSTSTWAGQVESGSGQRVTVMNH